MNWRAPAWILAWACLLGLLLGASPATAAGPLRAGDGLSAPTAVLPVQSCSACLAGCRHQLLACSNSNASPLSCQHASHFCTASCRRTACAPGATQPATPDPPRIKIPGIR